MTGYYIPLEDRAILKLTGADSRSFLQGIITNNIDKATPEQAIYTLLLTPQGKILFDFFVIEHEEALWLDCAKEQTESLIQRLNMYKLRLDVIIEDVSKTYEAAALLGGEAPEAKELHEKPEGTTLTFCKGIVYVDPRSKALHARAIIERENNYQSFEAKEFARRDIAEYEQLRIANIVPDTKDFIPDKSFPLQYNMEELNAVDFEKGCYVGQEVTARSKHRGKLRKKLYCVEADGPLPALNTDVTANDKRIGTLLSSAGTIALAQLEIEGVEGVESLVAGETNVKLKN